MFFSKSAGGTVILALSRERMSVQLPAMVARGDLGEESLDTRSEYIAEASPEP